MLNTISFCSFPNHICWPRQQSEASATSFFRRLGFRILVPKKMRSLEVADVYLFIYLFTYLFIYLFIHLFVCLFIYLFIYLQKLTIII